jgi:hypothetical protein
MSTDTTDRPLLAAAVAYAASIGYGARVDLREHVPGEPLGIRAPGGIAAQLALAWGGGSSAPWPMAVAALALGLRRRPGTGVGTAGVALGTVTIAGQFVEPVTWGRRPSSPAVTRSIALNLAACGALVLAGRRAVLAAGRPVR